MWREATGSFHQQCDPRAANCCCLLSCLSVRCREPEWPRPSELSDRLTISGAWDAVVPQAELLAGLTGLFPRRFCVIFARFAVFCRKQLPVPAALLSVLLGSQPPVTGAEVLSHFPAQERWQGWEEPQLHQRGGTERGCCERALSRCLHLPEPLLGSLPRVSPGSTKVGPPGPSDGPQALLPAGSAPATALQATGKSLSSLGSVSSSLKGSFCLVIN